MLRYETGAEPGAAAGIWPLYVGLFLALLTLFILLFGLSTPEASRTLAVMDSLHRTFAPARDAVAEEGLFPAGAAALQELDGDLSGLIRIARVEHARGGSGLRVMLPATELFLPGDFGLRTSSLGMIDRTIAALASPPAGLRLQVSFTLGVAGDAVSSAGEVATPLAVRRCGALARTLVDRGAVASTIAVGVDPAAADGQASFTFRFSPAEGDGKAPR